MFLENISTMKIVFQEKSNVWQIENTFKKLKKKKLIILFKEAVDRSFS